MERVDLGKVTIVDFPEVSASEQARVLVKLLRKANGANGKIAEQYKYPIVDLAGAYQSEETIKKALRALRHQCIITDMRTIDGCVALTISPFVYDESFTDYETNAPRIEPKKRTRGRKANSTSPKAGLTDGAARQSDMRPALVMTAPRAGDNGAARQSDMRPAPTKTAPRAGDMAPRAGDDGAARQFARAQSSVITADQEQLLRDQETMRRDFEGERLRDPERQVRREEPRQENGPGTVAKVSGIVTIIRIADALDQGNDANTTALLRAADRSVIESLTDYHRSVLNGRPSIPRELWDLKSSGENAA
jgi:hypothetical protein